MRTERRSDEASTCAKGATSGNVSRKTVVHTRQASLARSGYEAKSETKNLRDSRQKRCVKRYKCGKGRNHERMGVGVMPGEGNEVKSVSGEAELVFEECDDGCEEGSTGSVMISGDGKS